MLPSREDWKGPKTSPHGERSSTACSFWRTSTPPFTTAFAVPLHHPKHLFFKLVPVSRWVGRLVEVTRSADDASEDPPSTELICNPRAWQKADGRCCDNLDFPSRHMGINLHLYILHLYNQKVLQAISKALPSGATWFNQKQYYFSRWRNTQSQQN